MKMEPLRSGSLKIWMTHTDMRHWGLQFEQMSADDPATRQALLRLIAVAEDRAELPPNGDITVEALPIDGGCLLLLTPRQRLRAAEPLVCAVQSADELLRLRDIWQPPFPSSSLFGWEAGYRLIVYPDTALTVKQRRLLREFTETIATGRLAAAYTEEHGKPLVIGYALQALCR